MHTGYKPRISFIFNKPFNSPSESAKPSNGQRKLRRKPPAAFESRRLSPTPFERPTPLPSQSRRSDPESPRCPAGRRQAFTGRGRPVYIRASVKAAFGGERWRFGVHVGSKAKFLLILNKTVHGSFWNLETAHFGTWLILEPRRKENSPGLQRETNFAAHFGTCIIR